MNATQRFARAYVRESMNAAGGDVISVEYRQALGCITLSVLND